MPIDRYQIRNVYSLSDPELYKAADKDDPEALLEGVAMAGLVGVIRLLGDLAEFAAEIFHELHEEVTATAARGHGLLVRAQQLELEIPSVERSFLSQLCHSAFFPNSGIDWHPNRKATHNLINMGDLPRFVMNSYEECRGPPRLFLLDKFDVGGAGACLKRYTDPSFYKVDVSSYEIENAKTRRDKKIRKNKKQGSQWKGGGTPEVSPNSKAKLHQLFLEDRLQNGTSEPTHHVQLKRRPNKSPFDSKTGESYMNKLLNSQLEGKIVHQVPCPSIIPVPSDFPNQSGIEKFMDTMSSPFNLATQSRSPSVSSSLEKTGCRNPADNLAGKVTDRQISDLTTSSSSEVDEKKIAVDEEIGIYGVQNGYRYDDVASEMDNYVDAPATMESELETGDEFRGKIDPSIDQGTYSDQFSDSQLRGSTEIPFRPRVAPEKIPGITHGACIDVNQGVILEEASEDDGNFKNEEHQVDFLSPASSLLSFQFFGNYEGEVLNEHPNDGSSPIIHLPNILEISQHNHSTTSVDSRCSSPHSGISRADEQPFGVSLAEHDSVVEETLDSSEICCLPEEKLKEIGDGDDVLHISDSPEAEVSYFSEDGTEPNNTGIGIVTHAVSDLDDADKNGELKEKNTGLVSSEIEGGSTPVYVPDDVDRNDDNALSTHKDDTELEVKGEEDSVESESAAGLLPLDVDKNDDNALLTHEDDTELEGKEEEDSVDSDSAAGLLPLDVDKNDDNALSTHEDDTELEGKGEEDSVESDSAAGLLPLDVDKYEDNTHFTIVEEPEESLRLCSIQDSAPYDDSSKKQLLDSIPDTSLAASHDDDSPSLLHDQTPEENSQIGQQAAVLHDLGNHDLVSKSMNHGDDLDIASGTHMDHQIDSDTHLEPYSVNPASESVLHEEDLQGKPMTVSVSVPDKTPTLELLQTNGHDIDQVKHQLRSDPCPVNLATQSEEDPQGNPMTESVSESLSEKLPQATDHGIDLFDQVKHQFHSDPYPINLASQSEEDPQGKSMTLSVSEKLHTLELPQATSQDIDLFDQVKHHFHSDPYSVKLSRQSEEDPQGKPITVSVSEKLPTSELPQATSLDIDLFDQVKHQSHSHPHLVNLASQSLLPENPPTLELPQAISHDIDLSDQVKHKLPPVFPGFSIPPVKVEDTPPLPPLPPMQWRMKKLQNPLLTPTDGGQDSDNNFTPVFQSKPDEIKNPETEDEKFKHEGSLHTEDHDKSEGKSAENLVPQQTDSGQEIFRPSSNAYLVPQGDEMLTNIRPMKIQRPRSPLIDAVATHDKSKLRKVSDRAMSQITKGQENDKLLEQIRTKSYNLKPAVQTRPNIHGPTTNVRLAAILEKANAIRQAFAGSDDDDDSDGWSDS